MPMPAEDLQALANQSASVLAESFAEPLNFIPIAFDSPTESTQDQLSQQSTSQLSVMAPPKAPLSVPTKRKISVDDITSDGNKKSRRTVKSRQAKRSKI